MALVPALSSGTRLYAFGQFADGRALRCSRSPSQSPQHEKCGGLVEQDGEVDSDVGLGEGRIDEELQSPRESTEDSTSITCGPLNTPCRVSILERRPLAAVTQVAAGGRHALMLLADGTVYACGMNDQGQLGVEQHQHRRRFCRSPRRVQNLPPMCCVAVAAGDGHSVSLTDQNRVYTWGSNDTGQCGIGSEAAATVDTPELTSLLDVCYVAAGGSHNLALTTDGLLFSWGSNSSGQLGLGKSPTVLPCAHYPRSVNSLNGVPVKQVAAGGSHSLVLTVSGAVFVFGANEKGQLGFGDPTGSDDCRHAPVQLRSMRHMCIGYLTAGSEHTLALSKDGRLFAWGAGNLGQLGGGRREEIVSVPRQVADLMGTKVLRVAAGRWHTLACTSRKVYAWGLGAAGQLGLAEGSQMSPCSKFLETGEIASRPTAISSLSNMPIQALFAGGDQSYVQLADVQTGCVTVPGPASPLPCIRHLTVDRVEALLDQPDRLVGELEAVLCSAASLNASFLLPNDEHMGTGRSKHGVNLDAVRAAFNLMDKSTHAEKYTRAQSSALSVLLSDVTPPADVESLRWYLIVPWAAAFADPAQCDKLQVPYAEAVLGLYAAAADVLHGWWARAEARQMARMIRVYRRLVQEIVSKLTPERRPNAQESHQLCRCLRLLGVLNRVNQPTRKIPYELFYVPEIKQRINLQLDYALYLQKQSLDDWNNTDAFVLCRYPFIFDGESKSILLSLDAQLQREALATNLHLHNLNTVFVPFANQIKFVGEEADDVGGVRKEFFMLLFQELLHPQYGMFVEDSESRLLWFSGLQFVELFEKMSMTQPIMYQLTGALVGLVIYNNDCLNFHFPLALYKKLLNCEVGLTDLKEISPTEGWSLEQLLDYDGTDVEQAFDLSFSLTVDELGERVNVPLMPNGDNVPVTNENRQEYVRAYVDYKLNGRVRKQFDAFQQGFGRVMDSPIVPFFRPQELMEMVIGNESYDWDTFRQITEYKGEYWAKHPTIIAFWDAFFELDGEQRKKFLLFLTGSDRIPILGMHRIKMTIQAICDHICASSSGLRVVAARRLHPPESNEPLLRFYGQHEGKFFYHRLVQQMTTGPVLAIVLTETSGKDRPCGSESFNGAIERWRSLLGPTRTFEGCVDTREPGLRAAAALSDARNALHGSDSHSAALHEARLIFGAGDSWLRIERAAAAGFALRRDQLRSFVFEDLSLREDGWGCCRTVIAGSED